MGFPLYQTGHWHGYLGALSRVYRGAGMGSGGEDPRQGAGTPVPSAPPRPQFPGVKEPRDCATCGPSTLRCRGTHGAGRGGRGSLPGAQVGPRAGLGVGVGVGGSPMAPLARGQVLGARLFSFICTELVAGSPQEHGDTRSLESVPKPLTQEASRGCEGR